MCVRVKEIMITLESVAFDVCGPTELVGVKIPGSSARLWDMSFREQSMPVGDVVVAIILALDLDQRYVI